MRMVCFSCLEEFDTETSLDLDLRFAYGHGGCLPLILAIPQEGGPLPPGLAKEVQSVKKSLTDFYKFWVIQLYYHDFNILKSELF